MPLTEGDREQVQQMAELEVRRYFDTYLKEVFPEQVKVFIKGHDADRNAHGGVEKRFNKFFWMLLGAGGAGTGLGFGLKQLVAVVGAGG